MDRSNGEGSRLNSFALVYYLPEPLAGFLDGLRSEMAGGCYAKAHLTALPPRPLRCPAYEAWRELQANLHDFQPFRVELKDIEVFPITQVIYVSIGAGRDELERLHRELNAGCLEFQETYQYHPHVTLGQDVPPAKVAELEELAARRWREYPHRRDFMLERLTFVQNTLGNHWTDLARCALDHSNISI
jgi:2'-5' RNA ligase